MADPRYFTRPSQIPAQLETPTGHVTDNRGRPLRDLRISVTDRCNFRCVYCMPKEVFGRDFQFLPKAAAAHLRGDHPHRPYRGRPRSREDPADRGRAAAARRPRRTRRHAHRAAYPDGRRLDIALTTNGSALAHKAQALKDAGLNRVTVSLDSLDDATFRAMNDIDFPVARVLHGIDVRPRGGSRPDQDQHGGQTRAERPGHRAHGPALQRDRLHSALHRIHGCRNHQRLAAGRRRALGRGDRPHQRRPAAGAEAPPNSFGETSARWRYRDGTGEIGVISSVTQAFCHSCTRVRISTEGKLFTCLFATGGHD